MYGKYVWKSEADNICRLLRATINSALPTWLG
jgi:hypothetical protein